MLFLSVRGLWLAVQKDPLKFVSLGFLSSSPSLLSSRQLGTSPAGTHPGTHPEHDALYLASMYLWGFLLAYSLPVIHIQIITRFFSSVPAMYWTAASFVLSQGTMKIGAKKPSSLVFWYFAAYSGVGLVLFSNFYPPA